MTSEFNFCICVIEPVPKLNKRIFADFLRDMLSMDKPRIRSENDKENNIKNYYFSSPVDIDIPLINEYLSDLKCGSTVILLRDLDEKQQKTYQKWLRKEEREKDNIKKEIKEEIPEEIPEEIKTESETINNPIYPISKLKLDIPTDNIKKEIKEEIKEEIKGEIKTESEIINNPIYPISKLKLDGLKSDIPTDNIDLYINLISSALIMAIGGYILSS
jgi:type III secretory pathway component EscR